MLCPILRRLLFSSLRLRAEAAGYCTVPVNPNMMTIKEVRDSLINMVGVRKKWIIEETKVTGVMQKVVSDQSLLPKRKPSDSYVQAVIPLSDPDNNVRDKYITFAKKIRFGRLLEDFDSLAGLICYNHNLNPALGPDQKSPYAFVTRLVDRIEQSPTKLLSPYKDIILDGQVTWVGRSSMECTMNIKQEIDGELVKVITARYLFVAVLSETSTPGVVNPLDPQTPEEIALFKLGEENKIKRQRETTQSLLKTPPTEDERLIIHDLFLSTVDLNSGTFKVRVKPENTVWMEDAIKKTLLICHPEQRNLYNKIFGGFLMRMAYELAWANASIYARKRPRLCKVVDDILFNKPVEIGSLLLLSSQVVYTKGSDLQIHVHAEVDNLERGINENTNDFHFTFDMGVPNLPRVIPKTYSESMLYLVGKRHYES
ncbi:acyl-coenzyme A thioesterase 9, mitochondrial-like [Biomphalaria glabrata]|uniref:Acyl-coenzyme A thioesterase 9, mitochondrial-like n=1 Tax=Biomphalaria glabrata TaxID=6526 RepID=A0A2C9KE26_BIOGL|nr:acyl-coenzyme A thioesterase 9, mitochondrial-like [Biomphalaria glabrata]XP_055868818.1 acyl-coenzyme A thioesterase 9, mitochondrial-like [Biomphalaria glabrata]